MSRQILGRESLIFQLEQWTEQLENAVRNSDGNTIVSCTDRIEAAMDVWTESICSIFTADLAAFANNEPLVQIIRELGRHFGIVSWNPAGHLQDGGAQGARPVDQLYAVVYNYNEMIKAEDEIVYGPSTDPVAQSASFERATRYRRERLLASHLYVCKRENEVGVNGCGFNCIQLANLVSRAAAQISHLEAGPWQTSLDGFLHLAYTVNCAWEKMNTVAILVPYWVVQLKRLRKMLRQTCWFATADERAGLREAHIDADEEEGASRTYVPLVQFPYGR